MELLGRIKGLFTGKKSLEKISIDELRKERLRLEQIEQRVGRDVDDLEKRKQQLFVKGKDEASQRQQVAIARKIKELDATGKGKDKQLAMISRQMRVLSGLITIKENQSLVQELGVSSIVSRMDIGELQKYVERATVAGQFQMERFAEILKAMETPEGMELAEEDEDVLSIVAAMQESREAEEPSAETAVEDGMKKVEDVLHRKDSADEPGREE